MQERHMSAEDRCRFQTGEDASGRVAVFGAFRLALCPPRLMSGAAPVKLGRRALELLAALVERAGDVVSRAELERQVWPHSIVEESSLRVHVAAIRRALGDGVGGARYIANVPGRGYSFVAPVATAVAPPSAPVRTLPAEADRVRLPQRLTNIVGRDDVLAALAANLPRRRLVSIVGHGGIGKTSLALAVAAEVAAGYPDGACFVDLAPVRDPREVAICLAAALGVADTQDDPQAALLDWLAPRRILLVVDNCEHLLQAATALVEAIVRAAPGVHVLATSREPLDADGEWVFRIGPLGCPPDTPGLGVADAMSYAALRLLVERAAASSDAFVLTAAMVESAAALCRRVDGVPLAIEFAAARVGLLGISGVAAQLDDRLRLLGSGRRTVLPRHRTLRALLDWSYDLLTPEEQRVLAYCGVFVGPFALASAVAVMAGPGLPQARVRQAILSLAAKSLLSVEHRGTTPRFSLLGITRAYALDRLAPDPACDAVAARHAAHVVDLLLQCRVEASRPGNDPLAGVRHVAYNLRAALEWAWGPRGDPAVAVRLAAAMPPELGGVMREGEMGAPARAAGDACLDPHLDTLRRNWACSFEKGDYRAALQAALRGERVAAGAAADAALLDWNRMRAQTLHFLGDHRQADRLGEQALARPDAGSTRGTTGPDERRVALHIVLARSAWIRGEGARAAALLDDALADARQSGHPLALAQALGLAACPLALWRGDDAAAAQYADGLGDHAARHALAYWQRWAGMVRGVLALRAGDTGALAAFAGCDTRQADHGPTFASRFPVADALGRCTDGHVGWNAPEVWRVYGEQLRARGDVAGALHWIGQGLALARRQGALAWELRCLVSAAHIDPDGERGAGIAAALDGVLARLAAEPDNADRRAARRLLGQIA
jgi:predicted ATPase/DNA-binding winged helix-turn-helix (wHTH) protein